jgi:hypothetical protein
MHLMRLAAKWDSAVFRESRCKACAVASVLGADRRAFNKTARLTRNNLNIGAAIRRADARRARLPSDGSCIAAAKGARHR